ncbi:TetR/AcrR family transcriptional regulator [Longirhabdus pacifica]|uniref:TetR/AcrR family transcriptional regulator n=1 Tax=Longirhabdus pacifica TaxID=2305227 RepID=UPI0013E8B3BD|nr:TetR/AcrR family transcriptional regulator [Longirhabdus pacifica]
MASIDEKKNKYAVKLLPYVRKFGIDTLKTDEIASIMDISKATMYKYFSSKDEIIAYIVDLCIAFIEEDEQKQERNNEDFVLFFQQSYKRSILLSFYISDIFLKDLKTGYPSLYETLTASLQDRIKKQANHYDLGISRGVFNHLNSLMICLSEDVIIRKFIDPLYLLEHDMTLKQALVDYYQLKKHQTIHPEIFDALDDTVMMEELDYVVKKMNANLHVERG